MLLIKSQNETMALHLELSLLPAEQQLFETQNGSVSSAARLERTEIEREKNV
jgi:hypothetical protein